MTISPFHTAIANNDVAERAEEAAKAAVTPVDLDWRAIAVASISSVQVAALEALAAADTPLSPTEIAERIGEKLGNASYHIRMLRQRGLVVLVATQPVRGALQHFYSLAKTATEAS